ncbi:transposase ORF B, IS911, partial [Escherichia coli O104:H4 str. E112/10]
SGRVSAGRTSPLFSTCSQENQWAGPSRSRRTAGLP